MRIKTVAPLSLIALTLAASVSNAQQTTDRPLSYDYAYGSLAITELDSGGLEGGGSFTIAPNIHVFASYQDWELSNNADRSILQVGAGYHWDIANNLDLIVALAYADSELDPPGPGKVDDSGAILSAALRGWLTNSVELSGAILLDDSLGSDVNSVLEIGGDYYLSNQFSVGGRVRVDEDETTLFVGGRYHFGNRNQR